MKFKPVFLAFLATSLILTLLIAPMIDATSPSVVVTTDNLVLLNPDGSINFTTIYCTTIDEANLGEGVKILKLVVENGTSFPASPVDKQVFYRSDTGGLYVYNVSSWQTLSGAPESYPYGNLTGTPDLSVMLVQNATKTLLANWNAGNSGMYGIYGLNYVDTTTIHVQEIINSTTNGYVKVKRLIVENSSTAPSVASQGLVYYNSADNCAYVYSGSAWLPLGNGTLIGSPIADLNMNSYGIYGATYLNTTTIYCSNMNASIANDYVRIYRMVIENASSAPTAPDVGYVYFDTVLNAPYCYNGTHWLALYNATGGTGSPDLTVYLFVNGTRQLTANWNAGAFGIYGLTMLNATTIYCSTIDELVSGSGVKALKLIVENGTAFPGSPVDRQIFFRSDVGYLYIYNNSAWTQLGTTLYSNLTGTPDLTVYLTKDGATALSGNWNIGGSYGIYGATWVNATNISVSQLWYGNTNITDLAAFTQQMYSIMIFQNGSNYHMRNGTTMQIDFTSTNLTLVEQFASGNLTSGLIFLKGLLWNTSLPSINDNVMVVEQYDGQWKFISPQAKFMIPQLATDPNTTGWTQAEQGRMWYNTGQDLMKYWNGSEVVVFPGIYGTGGGNVSAYVLPYSYTLYTSGGYWYAEDQNGNLDFINTNVTYVLQSAINSLPDANRRRGKIFCRTGAYSLSGTGITLGKETHIIGEGIYSTIFTKTTNSDCFIIDPANYGNDWGFMDLQIDMDRYNGNGIYSSHAGAYGEAGGSSLTNLRIVDVDTGYAGINLTDCFHTQGINIWVNTYGTGYAFYNTDAVGHLGNSHFIQARTILKGNNGIGILVAGAVTYIQNLFTFDYPEIENDPAIMATNTTGIWLYGTQNNNLYSPHIENCAYNIRLSPNSTKGCEFNFFWGMTNTYPTTCAVQIDAGAFWNTFYSGYIDTTSRGGAAMIDSNTYDSNSTYFTNKFIGVIFQALPQGTLDTTQPGRGTELRNCYAYNQYGLISTPFGSVSGISAVSVTQGSSASPTNTTIYKVFNTDYIVTATATGLDVDIWDANGNVIASNIASLTAFHLSISCYIRFTWTSGLSISVFGD